MVIIKYISVPVFQLNFSDMLSQSSIVRLSHTILSLHFSDSRMGKTKVTVPASCLDAFSSVVCCNFFSIAVDFDAPSNC